MMDPTKRQPVGEEILVTTLPVSPPLHDPLRSTGRWTAPTNAQQIGVRLTELSGGIQEFLVQMDAVLKEAPPSAGGYVLDQIEVSAGITAGGKLTLFGVGAEGGMQGSLKFVFKR